MSEENIEIIRAVLRPRIAVMLTRWLAHTLQPAPDVELVPLYCDGPVGGVGTLGSLP